jgi:MSHA biogenesis protein MshE
MDAELSHKLIDFYSFLKQTKAVSSNILAEINYINDSKLIQELITHYGITSSYLSQLKHYFDTISYTDLSEEQVDKNCVALFSKKQAYEFMAIPFQKKNGFLCIAIENPLDESIKSELTYLLEDPIKFYFISSIHLIRFLEKVFPFEEDFAKQASIISNAIYADKDKMGSTFYNEKIDTEPALLLEYILDEGIKSKCSDIHLESEYDILRIGYRIDGDLQIKSISAARVADILLRRIKVLASLDTTASILPQDGSFTYDYNKKKYNMRVSVLTTKRGFSTVLRISSLESVKFDLEKTILDENIRNIIYSFINKKEGMLMITGPTGSGKTSTLYSTLIKMNNGHKKIFSIEDPIELNLDGVTQVQINEDVGMSFSMILKSALRQDPDVLMIGEIRDTETANISTRAAITGHKVLSTLHTKDTISVIDRFINLGVDNFILGTALNLIIAQRLMRKICNFCKKKSKISSLELDMLKNMSIQVGDQQEFCIGAGCRYCNYSGYSGRTGVYEILEIDKEMASYISLNNIGEFRKSAENYLSGKKLANYAYSLVSSEITTINELITLCS